jgi:hypothetical protein
MSVYLDLTREFNAGGIRAIVSSGQAVVLHRLAMTSKDGDWIVREDPAALAHIRDVLARHEARYRFGAPLDARWLGGGWSAHLEFRADGLRVRTDFVSRPPRLSAGELARLWRDAAATALAPAVPVIGVRQLIEIKKTQREKDYPIIGELARRLADSEDQLLCARSAGDLIALARSHPDLVRVLASRRPLLAAIAVGQDRLEVELDAERRRLMHADRARMERYERAAGRFAAAWPALAQAMDRQSLDAAHALLVEAAGRLLPPRLEDGDA